MASFQIVDYIVFAAIFAVSLGIGIFYSFRQNSTDEYFHGRRQLTLLPVSISLVATFTSAFSMLGTPAEIYSYGTQYAMHIFGAILGNVMGALLFVPLFHPLKLTSVFEYIELRYRSKPLKLAANVMKLISKIFLNGVGIYAPSVALQTMTGLPVWLAMLICGITTTIYTSIGGMKAVIWTDVFQAFFIYIGMLTICVIGWNKIGGFMRVFEVLQEWDRLSFFNIDPDPTIRASFWSSVFCYGVLSFCWTAVQASVLRYSGLPTLSKAKHSLYLSAVGLFLSGLLFSVAGFVAFAYYASIACDPLRAGYIRSPNQILPYFVMDIAHFPGLPGLFVACLASTALSTASSTLNGSAAMVWQDLLSQKLQNLSEVKKATVSKAIVVGLGVLAITAGFLIMHIKGTLVQVFLGIVGAVLGPLTGLYFLGAINPKPNAKAAMVGFSVSLSFTIVLAVGSNLTKVHVGILPSPVSGCQKGDVIQNITLMSDQLNSSASSTNTGRPEDQVSEAALLSGSHSGDNGTNTEGTTTNLSAGEKGAFQKLCAISYLYYPVFGIAITTIVASLLSIHPYFAADYYVEDAHLFPFVRYLRKILNRKQSNKLLEVIMMEPPVEDITSGGNDSSTDTAQRLI